ncbi:MAG TPA: DNA/RNA non-specific endonuclease [Pararobbsia sp.]|nr:DNA/RNA non-specific endonuclease [Pararobbsia sp.]
MGICVSHTAYADCGANFLNGVEPKLLQAPAADRPHLLCFTSYAVLESGETRTAVWSAESLTRDKVMAARELGRDNTFHAEDAIVQSDRAELQDYARSGWDRGHMTPSGDMPDAQSQAESFSLANMIPQAPKNNRRIWEHIEASTRRLATSTGGVYVVTGPGYTSAKPNWLNDRVRIPDLVWKAVYVPGRGAGAYVVRNDAGNDYAVVSIAEMTRLSGVDPFPGLSASMRDTAYALPSPTPHQGEDKDVLIAEATLLGRAGDQTQVAASSGRGASRSGEVREAREDREGRSRSSREPRESRVHQPGYEPIDILATLESAIEETGRMLWRWIGRWAREVAGA